MLKLNLLKWRKIFLLKWGQQAFDNFRMSTGTGICHQVNLEYLSKVVWTEDFNNEVIYFRYISRHR